LTESYEYRLLEKGKITRSNWEATLSELQQEYAGNDAHAGFTLYRKLETLLPLLPTPPKSVWYSFDVVNGQLCQRDGTQWHPFNPNYDPGPPPPPRLPREVKASMIITTESNGEASSATKGGRKDHRFQPNRFRKPQQNLLSTSQQSSAVGTSGSTQQPRSQRQCTHQRNSQSTSKNSGHTPSQHQQRSAPPAQWRVGTTTSSLSPNFRHGWGQSTEQAEGEKGYPKCPVWKTSHRSRQPASQDVPTANNT